MMPVEEPSSPHSPKTPMARPAVRYFPKASSLVGDGAVFASGAFVALFLFWVLSPLLPPSATLKYPSTSFLSFSSPHSFLPPTANPRPPVCPDPSHDPPDPTFYDDPTFSYTLDKPIRNWDEKRREWLRLHPSFAGGDRERVLMVTGSQPGPCRNPIGDHLLLRFFKNKVDYCRRHGIDIFYNDALLHPRMPTFWAKYPLIRAAMVAHPEAEWLWWVDSDAAFTDLDFALPLRRYRDHNLVVHGWPHLVYQSKSWVSLNAGVFLIRNCQWSLDFMAAWTGMGPQTPAYEEWGKTLKNVFKDKVFAESDDQSALVYLLLKEREKWADKIYLENSFYFEGYWVEIVGRLENMTRKYAAVERREKDLRRRHAEAVAVAYAGERASAAREEGARSGPEGWRRPFITHFTGCQPCSGDHNKMYSGENCWEGMKRALHFADDHVLREYGYRHKGLISDEVEPLPFDFPAAGV